MALGLDIIAHAPSRRLPISAYGAFGPFVLACVMLFVAIVFSASAAQAHVMHAPSAIADYAIDDAEGAAEMTSETDGCESICCSAATCVSALLSGSDDTRDRISLPARYDLPADIEAEARSQTALKRPPRS